MTMQRDAVGVDVDDLEILETRPATNEEIMDATTGIAIGTHDDPNRVDNVTQAESVVSAEVGPTLLARSNLRWVVPVVAIAALVIGFLAGRANAPAASMDSSAGTVEVPEASGSNEADKLLQVGLELHRSGDLSAASQAYRAVLETLPNDQFALYNLGLIAQTEVRLDDAISLYDQALAVDASMVPALYNRGLALRDVGRRADAIADLRRVVEIDPINALGLYHLGNLTIAEGDVVGGTKLVNDAITLDPSLRGDASGT